MIKEINLMSQAACNWLSSGQSGRVLAVVTHAAYLLIEEEQLVWFATTETPMHRRCLQVSSPLPSLAVDSAFIVKEQLIELESGVNLNFHSSKIWESSTLSVSNLIEIQLLSEKLYSFCDTYLSCKAPAGFGLLLPAVLRIAKNQAFSLDIMQETILTRSAWPIIEKITRACLSHNFAAVLERAEMLIGLGEGLTPSGDDFLGGLFFGRYLLACNYPLLNYLDAGNLLEWIDTSRHCTNLISFTLLKDNALGHAPDPLNRLAITLLSGQSIDCVVLAATELTTLGHSTGWDMLTGFLVGMLLAFVE